MGVSKDWSENSRRMQIIKAIMPYGAISYKALACFPYDIEMIQRVVRKMCNENILRILYTKDENIRYITLQKWNALSSEAKDSIPEKYKTEYLSEKGLSIRSVLAKGNSEAKRIIRNGDTLLFAGMCGVRSYEEDRKPFNECVNNEVSNCYFPSVEIKNAAEKYRGTMYADAGGNRTLLTSRMIGLYVSKDNLYYMLYNIGKEHVYWAWFAEYNMQTHVAREMSARRISEKKYGGVVFLYSGNAVLKKIISSKPKKGSLKPKLNVSDSRFGPMYFLPQDKDGVEMMKIMSEPGWAEKIYKMFMETEMRERKTSSCDGYDSDSNTYIDVFCVPNLAMLYRFQKLQLFSIKTEKNIPNFAIKCFDIQLEFVKSVFDENITIISDIKFDDFLKKYRLQQA